jgi:hypothetical protein
MSAILNALLGWKGCAAIALLCLLAGAGGTWRIMSWREDARAAKVITRTVKQIVYRDRVTEKVVTKYLTVKAADAANTRNLIKDIPNHVTAQADARCILPLGLVRLWNRAVHGPIPDAAAGPDDAASGLACSDLAEAFAEAAGQYDATAHQLMALQDWVRQQRAVKP